MGQAFDSDGNVLGEATGETRVRAARTCAPDAARIVIEKNKLSGVRAADRVPMDDRTEQVALGRSLRGKFVRFLDERKTHPGYLVVGVDDDGMIELRGWSGFFAPHLVERVDHPHSAAEGNC